LYGTFMICDNLPRKKVINLRKVSSMELYDFYKLTNGTNRMFSTYRCTHCTVAVNFDQMIKHAATEHQISAPLICHELRRRV